MFSLRMSPLIVGLVALRSSAQAPEECLAGKCFEEFEDAATHFIQTQAQALTGEEDKIVLATVDLHSVESATGDRTDSLQNRTEEASTWTAATGCSGILCNGNCPITQNPTSDGGCCNSGWIGTGHQHCVKISSTNILKHSCGLSASEAAGSPSCKNDASFFSNKDKVEKCTLGGQTCTYTKYGWFARKIDLGGGNKQDKLECTCEDVPTYRRAQEGTWTLGLAQVDMAVEHEARTDGCYCGRPYGMPCDVGCVHIHDIGTCTRDYTCKWR